MCGNCLFYFSDLYDYDSMMLPCPLILYCEDKGIQRDKNSGLAFWFSYLLVCSLFLALMSGISGAHLLRSTLVWGDRSYPSWSPYLWPWILKIKDHGFLLNLLGTICWLLSWMEVGWPFTFVCDVLLSFPVK